MDDLTHFPTGAIRDAQDGKANWTETISWTALKRYADYMTGKRAKYGPGNFKKGIPISSYEESIPRHWHKYFTNKYENNSDEPEEDHLAAMLFNILGIMHEEEMAKRSPIQVVPAERIDYCCECKKEHGYYCPKIGA